MSEINGEPPVDQSKLDWRRASECGTHGACVEFAEMVGCIALRDSKQDGQGPVLVFSPEEMRAFVKSGELDGMLRPS